MKPVFEVRVFDLKAEPPLPTLESTSTFVPSSTMWSHSSSDSRSRIKKTRGPFGDVEMTVRLSVTGVSGDAA